MAAGAIMHFQAMAYNNAWCNHRIYGACAKLSHEELDAERESFFPSIMKTLNHNLTVDWFYVDALEGGRLGPEAWADPHPCKTLGECKTDQRLIAFTQALSPGDLERDVRMNRKTHDQVERTDRVLLHLFLHQVHHRGQVHAMLAGTSVKPPQLDEFFMADEADIRAADFKIMGISEKDVWG